jgi:predicted SAM-dependent methyltransferase
MKLNLGCGNRRMEGWVGVDRHPCDAADVLCDLTKRLPFAESSIDAVHMDDFIEHVLDIPAFLDELARACKPGARIVMTTPHYSSAASWRNPTHLHHLSWFSFDYVGHPEHRHYMGRDLRLADRKLSFGGGILEILGKLFFSISPSFWERKLCFVFRASTLRFELEVTKENA